MPELIEVNEGVYYLSNHMNHGVIDTGDGRCVVIDTGVDDAAAQLVLAALEAKNLQLAAIINTHSHADHYGGNNYLVKETGCKVYAPPLEAAIMTNPTLEPFYIYGASAPQELKKPLMLAKESPVDVLLEEPSVTIGDKTFQVIPLMGHSPNQKGIIVDDIFFCGDSLFSMDVWQRYVLVYAMNISETINSIERIKKTPAKSFIPSHVAPSGEIIELADENLERIQSLVDDILEFLIDSADTTTILGQLCAKHKLTIRNMQQYYLCVNTLKAYLSYLLQQELIAYTIDNNRLLWRNTE